LVAEPEGYNLISEIKYFYQFYNSLVVGGKEVYDVTNMEDVCIDKLFDVL
jgi:hypothetical protein